MIHGLPLPFISYLYGLIAVLSIFSLVVFLCGNTSTRKKSHGKIGKEVTNKNSRQTRLNGTIFGGKAFSVVKTISWRKLQEDVEEVDACGGDDHDHQIGRTAEDDDDEVWRKPIMRGERCRPLDFSGKIVYDSKGNILQESPK